MLWFKNVSKDALVLAGCYGDSVGRAEFSGRHLLELDYLSPINSFGLIKRDVISFAYRHLMSDLKTLYNRTPGRPRYVLCEHEQQGHYMRGMIAHAMSIINKYCTIYQMFTKPSVYSYMWSIHPALRTDDIYAALLERLDERLIRIPWARTNRALKGITEGACSGLRPSFHEYARWVSGSLYGDLNQYVNPGWFEGIGIFNVEKLQSLSREIRHYKNAVFNLYDVWLWLASFRHFVEYLGKLGKSVELGDKDRDVSGQTLPCVPQGPNRLAREILGRSQVLNTTLKWVRKLARGARKNKLVRKSLQEYRAQLAH
jgi:asparagine synthase (glutamine-hydrolysing)